MVTPFTTYHVGDLSHPQRLGSSVIRDARILSRVPKAKYTLSDQAKTESAFSFCIQVIPICTQDEAEVAMNTGGKTKPSVKCFYGDSG